MQNAVRSLSVLALLAAIACGSENRTTTLGTTSTNSTIEGSVAGAGAASLRVAVPGTSAATTTDANGAFVLTDVPTGSAFLHFTGASTDTTLAVAAVIDAEYRRVSVTLTAGQASEQHEQSESEFRGAVTAIVGSTLTIAGRTVTVTDATTYNKGAAVAARADITVGLIVEVNGALQADGSVVARRISIGETGHADGGGNHDGGGAGDGGGGGDDNGGLCLTGTLSAVSGSALTVSGLVVNLTSTTEIYRGDAKVDAAALAVGQHLMVRGAAQADHSITATSVRILMATTPPDFHVTGSITALGATDKTVTIGDTVVTTDAHTELHGDGVHSLADFKISDRVDAEVVKQADGSLLAKELHRFALPPPPPPPPSAGAEAHGNVEAVSATSITVAGKIFAVTATTKVRRGDAAIAIGDVKLGEAANVHGVINAAGTADATEINLAATTPPPPPADGEVDVKAAIEAIGGDGISVGGHRYAVTASTVITRGTVLVSLTTLTLGEVAEVKGATHQGHLVAASIHVEAH